MHASSLPRSLSFSLFISAVAVDYSSRILGDVVIRVGGRDADAVAVTVLLLPARVCGREREKKESSAALIYYSE